MTKIEKIEKLNNMYRFEQLVQQNNASAWQQALDLYRGPLLEGWPEKWAQEARTQCQRSFERVTGLLAARNALQPPSPSVMPPETPVASLPSDAEADLQAEPKADLPEVELSAGWSHV